MQVLQTSRLRLDNNCSSQRFFSKLLQAKFYSSSVLPAISNSDYEGEISGQGDKVHIRTVPNVTVADYNGSITYADLETSTVELLIDQAKSYAFKIDDVLSAQGDIDMLAEASKDAAESMRIAVETDVLANVVTGATTIGSQTTITSSNILAQILDIAKELDELNIPEEGRFIVLPPSMVSLLKQSELRQAYLTGDATSPLRNGQVGQVDRFTVYQSNLLYTLRLVLMLLTPTFSRVTRRQSRSLLSSPTLRPFVLRALSATAFVV